ncbi:hypothetical protein HaLaN_30991 [Haematococcus lacustris]|uniref:Uncharacterized protein n=1 Tax=Haematococcus lacustris TaxID=44745 RepID=A0A6A0AG19_HAELA|nr:hypothetical protein HaLaN_30991 [Haematococcus lacustris]
MPMRVVIQGKAPRKARAKGTGQGSAQGPAASRCKHRWKKTDDMSYPSPLAISTAPAGATCSPQCAACSAPHCTPCPATCQAVVLAWLWQPCPCPRLHPCWAGWAQLPAQPRCAWLEGEVLGPGSEAAGCVASWLRRGAWGDLRGATTGPHITVIVSLEASETLRWNQQERRVTTQRVTHVAHSR